MNIKLKMSKIFVGSLKHYISWHSKQVIYGKGRKIVRSHLPHAHGSQKIHRDRSDIPCSLIVHISNLFVSCYYYMIFSVFRQLFASEQHIFLTSILSCELI
ncbi:hypothetical protein ACJX0J_034029 [Zea mays]